MDRAITMLREAGIAVKLNGALTPDNICDLEECVRYAKERGLIYEVNTYMFPPVRRDPSMAGVNRRFTPVEAARYNLESYRLLSGGRTLLEEDWKPLRTVAYRRLGWMRTVSTRQTGRCGAGRAKRPSGSPGTAG